MTDGLPPLREIIAKHQLRARKSLGQNFLLDLNLTRKIARHAGDLSAYDVLEVGPGPGGLTRALLAEGAVKVVAIERDARCIPALAEVSAAWPDRLTVIEGDALQVDLGHTIRKPYRVVANLPYNVGTEMLVRWLSPEDWPPDWASLTLMFQREVAERIVAVPGSKSYGRLSILSQWRSTPRIVMDLPPTAFTPPPKVSSAVVHFTALAKPRFTADRQVLERVVAAAFQQRRKMMRAALKAVVEDPVAVLTRAGIDPTARAETLDLSAFCTLAREVALTG
ncbi:MAG: 16S rRNA (adenine(1518)-N(6)/adenine(1519)-N(6))-dimethyltransferase RsmA [Pseudomonadota bacterium]